MDELEGEKPREKPRTMPGRNGGTLLVGPTNAGGTGRPPNEIRKRYRELNWGVLDELEKRDLSELATKELMDIAEHVAKYGVGTKQDITSGDEPIESLTDSERAARTAALLDRARERRTGPVDEAETPET